MASSIETTSTTTTLKNNGNTYATVDTNDDVTITNDLAVSGNVGINKAAPVTQLHIEGGGTSQPATTGTTPSAGTTLRIRPGNNAILDIGGDGTSGAWLQSYDQTGMQTEYPLLLNPNGGKVSVGSAGPVEALQVSGAIKVTGVITTDTANSGAMGYQNSKYRFISWGADASTKGAYNFEGFSSNGSASETYLSITSDGRGVSQFTARAWVNFNGTGTLSVRDSHNVSSVTDNGTGSYTVNIDTDMANINYSIALSASTDTAPTIVGTALTDWHPITNGYSYRTVGAFRVGTVNGSWSSFDPSSVNAQVFGD